MVIIFKSTRVFNTLTNKLSADLSKQNPIIFGIIIVSGRKRAVRTTNRREEGVPMISVFNFTEDELDKLNVLSFESADREWLRYISLNRTDKMAEDSYDIVTGPVANDQAIRTVNNYLKGYFTEDIAIQLLLPQNLKDQYVFKTNKALSILKFYEVRFA